MGTATASKRASEEEREAQASSSSSSSESFIRRSGGARTKSVCVPAALSVGPRRVELWAQTWCRTAAEWRGARASCSKPNPGRRDGPPYLLHAQTCPDRQVDRHKGVQMR